VGQGPSTFKSWWVAAGLHQYSFGHAHNLPLNLLAETGLIGLVAGAWLAWALARELARARGPWAAAALAATVALGVQSFADVPTTAPYIAAAWLVLARLGLPDERA